MAFVSALGSIGSLLDPARRAPGVDIARYRDAEEQHLYDVGPVEDDSAQLLQELAQARNGQQARLLEAEDDQYRHDKEAIEGYQGMFEPFPYNQC
jgi:hypothetical protein